MGRPTWQKHRQWRPTDVGSALRLWLEGDTVVQSGGVADQWTDKSGAGNNYTGALTARPSVAVDAAFGNRQVLTWDGTNDVMTGPAPSALISVTEFTIFAVFSVTAIDTNNPNFELNDSLFSDSVGLVNLYFRSTPTIGVYNWDGSRDTAATAVSTDTPTIVTARHAGGSLGIRLNEGSEVTAASGNTTGLTGTTTLGKSSSTNFFSGKIAAICILNTWPGETVAARFRRYLSSKYAVSL